MQCRSRNWEGGVSTPSHLSFPSVFLPSLLPSFLFSPHPLSHIELEPLKSRLGACWNAKLPRGVWDGAQAEIELLDYRLIFKV